MSVGLSLEVVVWIIALGTFSLIIIIWGLYKLLSYLRNRRDASIAYPESLDSSAPHNAVNNAKSVKDIESAVRDNVEARSLTLSEAAGFPRTKPIQVKYQTQRTRYINYKSDKSNDRILQDAVSRSSSGKQIGSKSQDLKSNGSRKSVGFELTIKSVEPVMKSNRSSNFLTILDRLNAIDEDEEEERKERERKRRRKEEENKRLAVYTASSAGIDADSSDETASQTFIGQDADSVPEPGQIQLNFIKASDRKSPTDEG